MPLACLLGCLLAFSLRPVDENVIKTVVNQMMREETKNQPRWVIVRLKLCRFWCLFRAVSSFFSHRQIQFTERIIIIPFTVYLNFQTMKFQASAFYLFENDDNEQTSAGNNVRWWKHQR